MAWICLETPGMLVGTLQTTVGGCGSHIHGGLWCFGWHHLCCRWDLGLNNNARSIPVYTIVLEFLTHVNWCICINIIYPYLHLLSYSHVLHSPFTTLGMLTVLVLKSL